MTRWRALVVGLLLLLTLTLGAAVHHGRGRGSSKGSTGDKPVHVEGYYRSDGTYVHGYDRALPGQGTASSSSAPSSGATASAQGVKALPSQAESIRTRATASRSTSSQTQAPPGRAYRVQERLTGKVVGVHDGDTITVLQDGKAVKVRLYGIDAPEEQQAFGVAAKRFTSGLAWGKTVTVLVHDTDRYGRLVGEVLLPGRRSLNEAIVRGGMAWWYQHFAPHDTRLQSLEQAARAAHRGLWGDVQRIPPWEFRQEE